MTPTEFFAALALSIDHQDAVLWPLVGVSVIGQDMYAYDMNRDILTVGVFSTLVNQQVLDHVLHLNQEKQRTAIGDAEYAGFIIVPRDYWHGADLEAADMSLNFHDSIIVYGCELRHDGSLRVNS